jgi:PadR family transcriptional regulator, regulatory protein PadR
MGLRLTVQVQLVLQALLHDPAREMYGLELTEETGLQPGTAYPILLRLEREGWVTSRWEDVDPRAEKRPARRYYRLTAGGAPAAWAGHGVADDARARWPPVAGGSGERAMGDHGCPAERGGPQLPAVRPPGGGGDVGVCVPAAGAARRGPRHPRWRPAVASSYPA